jgi:hypothetical protein
MRTDWCRPHLPFLGVGGGLVDGVASDAAAERTDQDPSGIEAVEHLP